VRWLIGPPPCGPPTDSKTPVYDQIDNLIKTARPRRSKSTSKGPVDKLTTSSHHSETSLNSGSGHSRGRGSIGDGKAIPGFSVDQRSGSRTSMDHPPSTHKRAESAASAYSESLNNSSVELEVCYLWPIAQSAKVLIYTRYLYVPGAYAQR